MLQVSYGNDQCYSDKGKNSVDDVDDSSQPLNCENMELDDRRPECQSGRVMNGDR
jgi:hypothetical protein